MDNYPPRENKMNNESYKNSSCPSLGLLDDAETSEAFPSIWNYCHHSRPIASPALKYQEGICLGGKYGECPVFLSQQAVPLPKHIRLSRTTRQRNLLRKKLVLGLTALGIVLLLIWGLSSQVLFFAAPGIEKATPPSFTIASPIATNSLLPTMTASALPTLTYTATAHIFSVDVLTADTPTYTPTLYRTATPTNTPSQLDSLIGTDYKFVIHKVLTGENLDGFAAKYNTSVEAIIDVNYGLGPIAWVDTLLVIPVGFTDISKLPRFVVYQVKSEERGISVENMAEYLRVNPLDLKYYNGWTSDGDRPLVGALLLVPRPRPSQ
jgi:hypothetical protein